MNCVSAITVNRYAHSQNGWKAKIYSNHLGASIPEDLNRIDKIGYGHKTIDGGVK